MIYVVVSGGMWRFLSFARSSLCSMIRDIENKHLSKYKCNIAALFILERDRSSDVDYLLK